MQDLIRSGPNYWRRLVRPSQNPMGAESRLLTAGGKAAMQVTFVSTIGLRKLIKSEGSVTSGENLHRSQLCN